MSGRLSHDRIESRVFSWLQNIPLVDTYARTRGWYFIAAWAHRITGLLMVLMVWGHITFLGSAIPAGMFLVWLFAVLCLFHGLNGGRLILYESFGNRNDESLMHWAFGLSLLYLTVLAMITLSRGQTVTPTFFWVVAVLAGLVLGYGVAVQVWSTAHSIFWRLQRISGAFLLPVLPAYLVFMQFSVPFGGHEDILRVALQSVFIKLVFLLTMVAAIYHGAYGLFSVVSDYVHSKIVKSASGILIMVLALIFSGIGFRAIIGGW
jgi:succinate dehydrogenase hydrophobic membrane anchor protein